VSEQIIEFLKRWKHNPIGTVGAVGIILLVLVAILAPLIAPHSPTDMNVLRRMDSPSLDHPFGTDRYGRDEFSRIIFGARVSLQVGIIAVSIGVGTGLFFGLIAGYYGRLLDSLIMRFMDILFAFPSILLALVVIAVLGPGLTNTMVAIGITNMPVFTRLVRASVLSVREEEYVSAAIALGVKDYRLLGRHVLPNVLAPVIVQASLALSGAILTEAALSFLGLGIQPPTPSWGSMLSEARRYMELAPWTAIFPSLAIMITVMCFNLFGDGLRDILDPKIRG